jgi:hypothetical protein
LFLTRSNRLSGEFSGTRWGAALALLAAGNREECTWRNLRALRGAWSPRP